MPLRIKGMQSGNNQELIKLRPVLSDADILQNALLSCTEVQVHNLQQNVSVRDITVFLSINFSKQKIDIKRTQANTLLLIFNLNGEALRFVKEVSLQQFGKKTLYAYLKLKLQKKQMQKYLLIGVKESNFEQLYSITKKVGLPKFNFRYIVQADEQNYLITMTFASIEALHERTFNQLKQQLESIGVSIKFIVGQNYTVNSSIQILNFFKQKPMYSQGQSLLAVWKIIASLKLKFNTAPLVTIKTISNSPAFDKGQAEKAENLSAEIFGANEAETNEIYETILPYLKNHHPFSKVQRNQKAKFCNTYSILFTKNVYRPFNITVQDFQKRLFKDYQLVSNKITKIYLLKTKNPENYHVKIYLRSELAGKQFLVHYVNYPQLRKHYKNEGAKVIFQMYHDLQTLAEINTRFGTRKPQKPIHHKTQPTFNNLTQYVPVQFIQNTQPMALPFQSSISTLSSQPYNQVNEQWIQYQQNLLRSRYYQQQAYLSFLRMQKQPLSDYGISSQSFNGINQIHSQFGHK